MLFITHVATGNVWVSAKQDRNSDVFRWANGMELTKDSSMWNTGEPSGPEECVDMWSRAKYALDNIPCSWKLAVLCEV